MKAKEFVSAYQSTHNGETFGNLTDIAKFMAKDRSTVRSLLKGLHKFGQNYFIPDVAEVIVREMK